MLSRLAVNNRNNLCGMMGNGERRTGGRVAKVEMVPPGRALPHDYGLNSVLPTCPGGAQRMTDLALETLTAVAHRLQARELSPVELTRHKKPFWGLPALASRGKKGWPVRPIPAAAEGSIKTLYRVQLN